MTIPNSVYQTVKVAEDRVASRQSVDHRASINAAVESNKSMFRQMLEYYRIRKTPGHLLMKDYFKYRLYDDERYTFEEKCQFVSDTFYHQTIRNCCDPRWWILADDKFWSYQLLSLNGIPVPETQAVIQNGTRRFGNTINITIQDEAQRFFEQQACFPLYCKPVHGIASYGNFLISGFQAGRLVMHDDSQLALGEFMQKVDRENGHLIQTVLLPHPQLAEISPRVSTIRVILIIREGRVEVLSTVWKIPSSDNIADNFWRNGNMLASMDIKTGQVVRLVGNMDGVPQQLPEESPESKRLLGFQLPDWNQVLELCQQGAILFWIEVSVLGHWAYGSGTGGGRIESGFVLHPAATG